jgi:hypothetical protein
MKQTTHKNQFLQINTRSIKINSFTVQTITCKINYVRQYIPWWFGLTEFVLSFSELLHLP